MRKHNVIRFWRGARRHPKWDLATPPNPRGRSPFRLARRKLDLTDPVTWLKGVMVLGTAGLIVLPVVFDAVSTLTGGKATSGGCRVVVVTDGDTVRMYCPGRGVEAARLTGFDTPEKFSPRCPSEFARAIAATWTLRWMIWEAGRVNLVRSGTDAYGRALVFMALDDVPVARRMIAAGHARAYDGGARQSWCSA